MLEDHDHERAQVEGDQKAVLPPKIGQQFVAALTDPHITYFLELLNRLRAEGSEDARQLFSDIDRLMRDKGNPAFLQSRLITLLLNYALMQAHEPPVVPENSENFGMRMPVALLEKLDCAVAAGAARNRSELVRNLLELAFSGVDASQMRYRTALMETIGMLLKNPEEMLLFYLIRSFFNRPDVGGVAKMLASIAGPLSEIIAAVGDEGTERVKEAVSELFEKLDTPDSESEESENAVNDVE